MNSCASNGDASQSYGQIHQTAGKLLAYCGRALKRTQQPLLAYPSGIVPTLFNLHRLKPAEIHLTDDPLKVLAAHQHDVQAVAVLNTAPEVYRGLLDQREKHGITAIHLL